MLDNKCVNLNEKEYLRFLKNSKIKKNDKIGGNVKHLQKDVWVNQYPISDKVSGACFNIQKIKSSYKRSSDDVPAVWGDG